MTAFNIVKFRVKPGMEQAVIDLERINAESLSGMRKLSIVKTGERTYFYLGEWDRMSDIVAARDTMIGHLDQVRHMLDDLGDGLGVTDPASGEVVVEYRR